MESYYIFEWEFGCGWAEEYDMLHGPNGFECLLTEPEDRTWCRDGNEVIEELNRLQAEVERLHKVIDAGIEKLLKLRESLNG